MHLRTRGVALLSVTAALAGGTLTTVTTTATAATPPSASASLLGLPIDIPGLLATITGATVGVVQTLILLLSPSDIGDLLVAADALQTSKLLEAATNNNQLAGALTTLTPTEAGDLLAPLTGTDLTRAVGGLTTTQLQSALGTLTATQTGDLLASAGGANLTSLLAALSTTQLTNALGTLTPAQITGLIGAGATDSVVSGLLGQATAVAAGTPLAAQVNPLLAQVSALLGAGIIPADPTNLASLLTTLQPLLATAGVDPALLTSLLGAANGLLALAPAPVAGPLQSIIAQITVLVPATGGATTSPTTTTSAPPPPATLPRPTATAARPAAAAPGAQFTAYRAAIGPLKLNRKRSSLRFTLTCAATAPKGCLVKVSAKIAGKSVMRTMTLALAKGRSSPITVTLSRSTTRRLKSKGGPLKITATTSFSSLPSASRTLKVKRLKKAVRTGAR